MNSDSISDAHAKLVCLGMDCLRLALGMDPVNYDAERVRELINARIDHYFERTVPASAREPGDSNG